MFHCFEFRMLCPTYLSPYLAVGAGGFDVRGFDRIWFQEEPEIFQSPNPRIQIPLMKAAADRPSSACKTALAQNTDLQLVSPKGVCLGAF